MLKKVTPFEEESIEDVPEDFISALMSIKSCPIPQWLHVKEIPLKPTIAPYCAGITAHTTPADDEYADGKFILLFDPNTQEGWDGTFRIITMFSTILTKDLLEEHLITQVAWSWLGEALESTNAKYCNLTGTVTKHNTDAFGGLVLKDQQGKIQIRASWSPVFSNSNIDLEQHFKAFSSMLETLSGRQLSYPYLQAI